MQHVTKFLSVSALTTVAILAACSSQGVVPNTFDNTAAGAAGSAGKTAGAAGKAGQTSTTGGSAGAGVGGTGQAGTGGGTPLLSAGGSGPNPDGTCPYGPDEDHDKDGWTVTQGDCNDCDPNVNPGALDIVNYVKDANGKPTTMPSDKQVDEDCDGTPTMPGAKLSCDAGLGEDVKDPFDSARAMGLCNVKVEENPADPKQRKWGVIKAGFNKISGVFLKSPIDPGLQMGILKNFGTATQPREGERIFGLSSGIARATGQPGFPGDTCGQSEQTGPASFPPGFPKSGSCGETGDPYDGVALDLQIRVPTNAHSMSFNFRFFTCEFPTFVCQVYNDVFAVIMTPSPLMAGNKMADKTNSSADVAFDDKQNVIGVNNQAFLTACAPGTSGYNACKGENELAGSGFETHAASAWLQSQVPVPAGQIIYLRFAIWDSADGVLDSSAVVDNFQFSADEGTGVVTKVDPPIN
jgi:hypothetical protein